MLFAFSLFRPVLSIRSVPAIRSIFFRIGCGRVACAVFVSSFSSLTAFVFARLRSSYVGSGSVSFSLTRYARPFVSFIFSSCPSRMGVSSLFFAVRPSSRIAHQFARRLVVSSRPAARFPVSSLVSFLLVPFSVSFIPFRPHRILVPSGDTRGGAIFFSSALVSFVGAVFHHAPRCFRKLILSVVSPCRLVYRLAGRM